MGRESQVAIAEKDFFFLPFSLFLLLFSLFLLLFMGSIALFDTIHGSHCTISASFGFIYSTFNKKFSISTK